MAQQEIAVVYRRAFTSKQIYEGHVPIDRKNGIGLLEAIWGRQGEASLSDGKDEYRRYDLDLYEKSSGRIHQVALVGCPFKGRNNIMYKLVRIRGWMAANGIRNGSTVKFYHASDGRILYDVYQPVDAAATAGGGGINDTPGATAPTLGQGLSFAVAVDISLNKKMCRTRYLVIPASCDLNARVLAPHLRPNQQYDVQLLDEQSTPYDVYECQLWPCHGEGHAAATVTTGRPDGSKVRWRLLGMGPYLRRRKLQPGDRLALSVDPGQAGLSIRVSRRGSEERGGGDGSAAAAAAAADADEGSSSGSDSDGSAESSGGESGSGSGGESSSDESGGRTDNSSSSSESDGSSSSEETGRTNEGATATKPRKRRRETGGSRAGEAVGTATQHNNNVRRQLRKGEGAEKKDKKRRLGAKGDGAAAAAGVDRLRAAKGGFDPLYCKLLTKSEINGIISVPKAMCTVNGVFASIFSQPLPQHFTVQVEGGVSCKAGMASRKSCRSGARVSGCGALFRHLGLAAGDVARFMPTQGDDRTFILTGWRPAEDPGGSAGGNGGEGSRMRELRPPAAAAAATATGEAPQGERARFAAGGDSLEDMLLSRWMLGAPAPDTSGGERLPAPWDEAAAAAAVRDGKAAPPPPWQAPQQQQQHRSSPFPVKEEPGLGSRDGSGAAIAGGGGVEPVPGLSSGGGMAAPVTGRRTGGAGGWRPVTGPAAAGPAPPMNTAVPTAAKAEPEPDAADAGGADPPVFALPASSIVHLHGYVPDGPPAVDRAFGELRVCGMTFHPELRAGIDALMAAWDGGLQQQMERNHPNLVGRPDMLARADPITQQMAVLGVDPPFFDASTNAAFRRHKLKSYVIRNRLGKMLRLIGEGCTADRPLPEDCPPWLPEVRLCADPMRGGCGLEAAAPIRDNTVLGVLAGYVMPVAGRVKVLNYAATDPQVRAELRRRAGEEDGVTAWQFLADAFIMPYMWSVGEQQLTSQQPQQRSQQGGSGPEGWPAADGGCGGADLQWRAMAEAAPDVPPACLSMLGYGGLGALVNDPRVDPRAWVDGNDVDSLEAADRANCMVLYIAVRGVVLPVLVTLRPIKPGEQLLCDYGSEWWRQLQHSWMMLEADGLSPGQALWGLPPEREAGPAGRVGDSEAATAVDAAIGTMSNGGAAQVAPPLAPASFSRDSLAAAADAAADVGRPIGQARASRDSCSAGGGSDRDRGRSSDDGGEGPPRSAAAPLASRSRDSNAARRARHAASVARGTRGPKAHDRRDHRDHWDPPRKYNEPPGRRDRVRRRSASRERRPDGRPEQRAGGGGSRRPRDGGTSPLRSPRGRGGPHNARYDEAEEAEQDREREPPRREYSSPGSRRQPEPLLGDGRHHDPEYDRGRGRDRDRDHRYCDREWERDRDRRWAWEAPPDRPSRWEDGSERFARGHPAERQRQQPKYGRGYHPEEGDERGCGRGSPPALRSPGPEPGRYPHLAPWERPFLHPTGSPPPLLSPYRGDGGSGWRDFPGELSGAGRNRCSGGSGNGRREPHPAPCGAIMPWPQGASDAPGLSGGGGNSSVSAFVDGGGACDRPPPQGMFQAGPRPAGAAAVAPSGFQLPEQVACD